MSDKRKNDQPDLDNVVRNLESELEATLNVPQENTPTGKAVRLRSNLRRSSAVEDLRALSPPYAVEPRSASGKTETIKKVTKKQDGGEARRNTRKIPKIKVNEEKKVSPLILIKKKGTSSAQKRTYEQSTTDFRVTASPVRDNTKAAPVRDIVKAKSKLKPNAPPVREGNRASPVREKSTSPVREKHITPVREHRLTPVREEQLAPVREKQRSPVRVPHSPVRHYSENDYVPTTTHSDEDGGDSDSNSHCGINIFQDENDNMSLHASDTEGYSNKTDGDIGVRQKGKINFQSLKLFEGNDQDGSDIEQEMADKITNNWHANINFEEVKTLFNQYKHPKNCNFAPPLVNEEIRKKLTASDKSRDLKLAGIQKSMSKSMSAAISIVDEAQQTKPDWQKIGQTLADMGAMLGHASREISKKRRFQIKNLLKTEYKSLCDSDGSKTLLFGDELPKQIMELNLTNRISARSFEPQNFNRGYNRGYQNHSRANQSYRSNSRHHPYGRSFLGNGRGNLSYRPRRPRYGRR